MKSACDIKKPFPKLNSDYDSNLKYKRKCKIIKRLIKEMVYENVALCDQIAYLQEKTLLQVEERNYLFKKLYNHQQGAMHHSKGESDVPHFRQHTSSSDITRKIVPKKRAEVSVSAEPNKVVSKTVKRPVPSKKKKPVKTIQLDIFGKPVFPQSHSDFTSTNFGED